MNKPKRSRISRSQKSKDKLPTTTSKGICTLTQQYRIFTIEIESPSKFRGRYLLQTNDVDIEFSKVFTEYIKNIQYQNSQRANSIFINEVY